MSLLFNCFSKSITLFYSLSFKDNKGWRKLHVVLGMSLFICYNVCIFHFMRLCKIYWFYYFLCGTSIWYKAFKNCIVKMKIPSEIKHFIWLLTVKVVFINKKKGLKSSHVDPDPLWKRILIHITGGLESILIFIFFCPY